MARDPSLAEKVRVIHRSSPFGIPPVVVGPSIRPQLKSDLQVLLLSLDQDPEGHDALRAIGVDRFVLIEDEAYTEVRTLLSDVKATR
jgi:phosphonate transport system substrate-binding protein